MPWSFVLQRPERGCDGLDVAKHQIQEPSRGFSCTALRCTIPG